MRSQRKLTRELSGSANDQTKLPNFVQLIPLFYTDDAMREIQPNETAISRISLTILR